MEIINIDTAGSSNNKCLELLESQLPEEGTVIRVINQTEGKGQKDNKWHSEPESNLTFSVILYPGFLPNNRQFSLSKAIALSVADYVALFASDVKIKWYNDILVKGRKVAGILIENIWQSDKIKASVVGVGLNMNQEKFPAWLPGAASLIHFTGVKFNLDESLKMLHNIIMGRYLQLQNKEFAQIDADYSNYLYGKNEVRTFIKDNSSFEALIVDVDERGYLHLKLTNGVIQHFGIDDIKML